MVFVELRCQLACHRGRYCREFLSVVTGRSVNKVSLLMLFLTQLHHI